ncbi:hypothetical protein CPT_Spernnie_047 [Streptomyces phage Spernnie]|uniref:Uncharacterized protein n=1 Tax=Streptomyces phage Spernnie TaxID=2767588 RepID=A0A873WPQ9_9CAUD|nr:hypothetical protein KGG74_gp47 [Streptomyces phage Spernnie]QPB09651.1 hypothetical protein CPT_Spernnie_047 [Streptomyces phage Spernnie]
MLFVIKRILCVFWCSAPAQLVGALEPRNVVHRGSRAGPRQFAKRSHCSMTKAARPEFVADGLTRRNSTDSCGGNAPTGRASGGVPPMGGWSRRRIARSLATFLTGRETGSER